MFQLLKFLFKKTPLPAGLDVCPKSPKMTVSFEPAPLPDERSPS